MSFQKAWVVVAENKFSAPEINCLLECGQKYIVSKGVFQKLIWNQHCDVNEVNETVVDNS